MISGNASFLLIKKRKTKAPMIFTREIKGFQDHGAQTRKYQKITDQLAHHLTGIILTVIGK